MELNFSFFFKQWVGKTLFAGIDNGCIFAVEQSLTNSPQTTIYA